MPHILAVHATWDDEASVWIATSHDVPGLVTEADTIEKLTEKLEVMIPELLDANDCPNGTEVPFELLARQFKVAHREAA